VHDLESSVSQLLLKEVMKLASGPYEHSDNRERLDMKFRLTLITFK